MRQIWKKQDQRYKESMDVLSKYRSILKKFIEIVIFLEEFLDEYTQKIELQENNFYQIAILLAIIRLFLKIFLLACLNSETKIE